ncbi:hypothetical protein CEB3_c08680 [Peptococcaceae bacterium CEB3]|nr:hypothetical protein CEB3_c08680 [Peptococcaceae bacterium CEB3]
MCFKFVSYNGFPTYLTFTFVSVKRISSIHKVFKVIFGFGYAFDDEIR